MREKWQESIAPHLIRNTTQEKKFGSVTLLGTYEPFKVEAPIVLREGIGGVSSLICVASTIIFFAVLIIATILRFCLSNI